MNFEHKQAAIASIADMIGEALRLHQANRLPDAELIYNSVLQIDPNCADALHLMGLAAYQRGNNDAAESLILKAIAQNDRSPHYHANLGLVHRRQGRFAEAVKSQRRALDMCPDNADCRNNLGNTLQDMGELDEAVACFESALALRPGFVEARFNHANALRKLGRPNDACASYQEALKLRPDFAEAHTGLGNALQDLGRLEEAAASYVRAIELKPDDAEALNNFGVALQAQGRLSEAAPLFERALSLKPNYAEANVNLGNLLREKGEPDKAITYLHAAIALQPTDADAHNNLAIALQSQGKLHSALDAYETALRLCPSALDARNNLGKLLWAMGRRKDAMIEIRKAAELAQAASGRSRVSAERGQELLVYEIMNAWIVGDYETAEGLLKSARPLSATEDASSIKKVRIINNYLGYLREILAYRRRNPNLFADDIADKVFVIGDSHCLAASGIIVDGFNRPVQGESRLIPGVKMWHVSQGDKHELGACLWEQLRSIPRRADLLFCVGEIDCRWNEGIWAHCRDGAADLQASIDSTVTGYLSGLAEGVRICDPASVTVHGVPAPKSGPFTDVFLTMIASVNSRMEAGALSLGWRFLDAYAATSGDLGIRAEEWDLDGIHLRPSFYRQSGRWIKRSTIPFGSARA